MLRENLLLPQKEFNSGKDVNFSNAFLLSIEECFLFDLLIWQIVLTDFLIINYRCIPVKAI